MPPTIKSTVQPAMNENIPESGHPSMNFFSRSSAFFGRLFDRWWHSYSLNGIKLTTRYIERYIDDVERYPFYESNFSDWAALHIKVVQLEALLALKMSLDSKEDHAKSTSASLP